MVKGADALGLGGEVESSTCPNKNTVGKEDNGKSNHKSPLSLKKKDSELCLWFLLPSGSSTLCSYDYYLWSVLEGEQRFVLLLDPM